jgi:hypothetical protein
MRQFFTWRFWAAFGALIGIAVLLKTTLPTTAASRDIVPKAATRTIDFISLVYQVEPSTNFNVVDGVVQGSASFVLDGHRTMRIETGTLGTNLCPDYTQLAHCVVFADLLGDAVIWFAIVPVEQGLKVTLPPIVLLLTNSVVELSNGWLVKTAATVDYKCPQETASLREFLTKFGPGSTTVIDVSKQRVTAVQCAQDVKAAG